MQAIVLKRFVKRFIFIRFSLHSELNSLLSIFLLYHTEISIEGTLTTLSSLAYIVKE